MGLPSLSFPHSLVSMCLFSHHLCMFWILSSSWALPRTLYLCPNFFYSTVSWASSPGHTRYLTSHSKCPKQNSSHFLPNLLLRLGSYLSETSNHHSQSHPKKKLECHCRLPGISGVKSNSFYALISYTNVCVSKENEWSGVCATLMALLWLWLSSLYVLRLFLMWTIFKIFIEFVTILLPFLCLSLRDLSSPARHQACTPCIRRWSSDHWTVREGTFITYCQNYYKILFFFQSLCSASNLIFCTHSEIRSERRKWIGLKWKNWDLWPSQNTKVKLMTEKVNGGQH